MHQDDGVGLRRFARQHLPLVEPWFLDAETQYWLGGPDWPRRMLELADRPLTGFRGAMETGRFRWLLWDAGVPVGYIDCGTFDRWTTWEGGPQGAGVVATIDVRSAAIAYVVDPTRRCLGYGSTMITQTELSEVTLFGAGVEPENAASVRAVEKAGFQALDPEPDSEGIVYFVWRRDGGKVQPFDEGPTGRGARLDLPAGWHLDMTS